MPLTQLAPPYPIFTDKNGDPLDAGYLYFGVVNLNPETNPIQVYYDSALTQPAAQPLRTSNGYVMRNGSPALIYANAQFSVTVRNKNSELVIYSPVGYGILPGTSATSTDQITYNEGSTGAVSRILTARLQDRVSIKDFGAAGDGVTDDYVAVQNAASNADSISIGDAEFLISQQIVMSVPKSFVGGGATSKFKTTPGFTGSVFRIAPAAGTDPKGWTVSDFEITNNGSATNAFLLDIASAGEYISKFTLSKVISNTQVSNYFVELLNSIPNTDGLFTSYFSDNWSLGGYYLENAGDSIYLERNTTTGAGVGYYVNQLGTAANITIRDGNCTSAGGALNMVKGANLVFENMQVECPVAFTGVNNAAVSIDRPSGGLIYNTKIINNNINTQGNPLYCVYLDNAVQTVIDGNELYCDVGSGAHIYIDTGARDTIIGNNKYYNRATGAEVDPIIVNNGIGTTGVWNNATISLAGWTSQGATENVLGFFKDRDGTVYIRGRVAGAATAPATLFTLPVGFRPKTKNIQFSAFGAVSAVRGEVQFVVNAAGSVVILTNNATALDLNGISFSTR
jgi:hypothetical protein